MIGNTVNVASRLCHAAVGGAIVAHRDVVEPWSGRVHVQLEAPLRVKGKGEPLPVVRITGLAG